MAAVVVGASVDKTAVDQKLNQVEPITFIGSRDAIVVMVRFFN